MGGEGLFKVGTIGTVGQWTRFGLRDTFGHTGRTPGKWGEEDREFGIWNLQDAQKINVQGNIVRELYSEWQHSCISWIWMERLCTINQNFARKFANKIDTAATFDICRDLCCFIRLTNRFAVIYFKLPPSANKGVESCWAGVWDICLNWRNKMILNGAKIRNEKREIRRIKIVPNKIPLLMLRHPLKARGTGGQQLLSSFSHYLAHADYQQNWGLSKFTALYTGP